MVYLLICKLHKGRPCIYLAHRHTQRAQNSAWVRKSLNKCLIFKNDGFINNYLICFIYLLRHMSKFLLVVMDNTKHTKSFLLYSR